MSDYQYGAYTIYLYDGDLYFADSTVTGTGTLIDGDNDDAFEDGDTITTPFDGVYLGTLNGFPVFGVRPDPTSVYPFAEIRVFHDAGATLDDGLPELTFDGTPDVFTFCFLDGTAIATPDGPRAVDTLQPGDLVLTHDGRAVPVLWMGHQAVLARFGTARDRMPVEIAAGALGGGLPERPLRVTADHALLVDGLLVNAGALVNGTTIRIMDPADLPQRFTLWHVETEAHDVILAEGTPAETFIDYAGRSRFDNHADYVARFGDVERRVPEAPWPRISAARLLPPALRARLGLDRAA